MKKLFPILMVVALTAGCGSGVINADCDSSHENFCDGDILYRVDLCGNAVSLGQCENGCNLEFTNCQAAFDAETITPAETVVQMATGLRDLPRIEPYDR